MAKTLMDFQTFEKLANDYATVIPVINKTVDQLRTSVEDARKGWQGDANNAFTGYAGQLELEIKQVNHDLGVVADALQTSEKKVAQADHESTGGFTSLSTNFA
ncbi:MAG: WXG100 family type VII secretion target [Mycobacterium sp.]|nr:WXG100 family type VII secretion target [Mycobacterium sp.]